MFFQHSATRFLAFVNIVLLSGIHLAVAKKPCPNPVLSCTNKTAVDTCCFNAPAGIIVLTEYLSYNTPTTDNAGWTISALETRDCDGNLVKNCDPSRAYPSISALLTKLGQGATLKSMAANWPTDSKGVTNDQLWTKNWAQFGTCISTLAPTCFGKGYSPGEEVPEFFRRGINLFRNNPTSLLLQNGGITISSAASYTLSVISGLLSRSHGAQVLLGCEGNNLTTVSYWYNVKGSFQSGSFESTQPIGQSTNCPSHGIRLSPNKGGLLPIPLPISIGL